MYVNSDKKNKQSFVSKPSELQFKVMYLDLFDKYQGIESFDIELKIV